MLNIIIFSKDRACQLELLLRSLKLFLQNWQSYSVHIIYAYSNSDYQQGYELVKIQYHEFNYLPESQEEINSDFKSKVLECFKNDSSYTMFLVDDLVFKSFVDITDITFQTFVNNSDILCLSLRLSPNIKYCYTTNSFSPPPSFDENLVWNWQKQSKNTDWGYPMSLDGHIFRTSEIYNLILNQSFNNPNTLESQLANHPLSSSQMICYSKSKMVNIPANKVQTIYSNRHANMIGLNELNQQFLNKNRLSLKPILDIRNISVHQEIPLYFLHNSQEKLEFTVILLCKNDAFELIYQIESLLNQTIYPQQIICICDEQSIAIINIITLLQQSYPYIEINVIVNYRGNNDTIEEIKAKNKKVVILETNKFISSNFIEDYLNNQNTEDTVFDDLQNLKYQKEILTFKLEQMESQLKFQLEVTNLQLQQTQSQLQQAQSQLQQTQSQLQQTQSQLQQTQSQLQQTQGKVDAIQSSKFWKLREKWFKFRRIIGITNDAQGLSLKTIYRTMENKIDLPKLFVVEIEQEKWDQNLPLVSVIIPCYNYGQYVEEAIDSVLNQTFKNLEIIVVDDGSTDTYTIEVLDNLNKPKTKLIRTTNQKLPAARNNGIKEAQGKYICCLDADDILKPTYIEKCIILMEQENLDVCYSWIQEFGYSDFIWQTREFILEDLIHQNCCVVSALFRKSTWKKVGGFNEKMIHGYEDWDFWIKIAKNAGRGKKINEPLFLYRKHGRSMIDDAKEKHEFLCSKLRENHLELYKDKYLVQKIQSNITNYIVTNAYDNITHSFSSNFEASNSISILFLLPYLVIGGAEKVALDVIRACHRANYHTSVITTVEPSERMGNMSEIYEKEVKELYQLPKLFSSKSQWKDFIFHILKSRSINIIFLAGSTYGYELLSEIKQHFPHIKVVNPIYLPFGQIDNNKRFYDYIDVTILENQSLTDAMDWANPIKQKVIQNGVDIEDFQPTVQSMILDSKITDEKFVISFIGRFSQQKCPDVFLNILMRLQQYDNLNFIMAGDGELYPEIFKLIQKFQLEDRVSLPGFINSKEYLGLSNLLILPSESEGRPNIVLESLAMGVPVIASSVGGLPEIIQDGYNGFLCQSGNVNDFLNRIKEVLNNQELYLNMRKNAREYAVNNLDIKIMYQNYLDTFQSLIETNKEE